jgi:two-component system phosphate regulon sensor histidine kinase PhoR
MPEKTEIEALKAENHKLREIITTLDKSAQMLVSRDVELREANNKLQSLDTQKSEFVAIAAHQLRTPLTSIRFAHQMLADSIVDKLTPDQLKALESARISIDRMFNMIEDLLVIDVIEYGDLKLTYAPAALEHIIDDILLGLTASIQNRSVDVVLHFAQEPSNVSCDPKRIKEALSNIIDNAVKYTSENGQVIIDTVYTSKTVTVTISDTGIGVEKSDVGMLFKKFSRMDNAKLVDANGSGLGLYIAKKIVEKHEGTILFSHHLPVGSSFIVSLPL